MGIFTLTELVETVSRVGLITGLPCVSVKAATLCQNKELSKKIWLKNGINTPVGGSFEDKDSIRNFFDSIGRRAFALSDIKAMEELEHVSLTILKIWKDISVHTLIFHLS